MNINDFRKQFEQGKLKAENGEVYDKWAFAHHSMEQFHSKLWDYSEYLNGTDIEQILISQDAVSFKLKGEDIVLECKKNDERSMPMDIINFRSYEKNEMMVIDRVLGKLVGNGGNILDIGANIGFTSIHWEKSFPNANIYAFEPMLPTFELLERNIKTNGSNRIKAYNLGMSNVNDKVMFTYYPYCTANSSIQNLTESEDVLEIEAVVKRYDDIDEFKDIKIDFVKCDIEGNEKFAFEGMKELLKRDKPAVCAELLRKYAQKFGYHPNEVLEFFKVMGYDCYGIGKEKVEFISDMSDTLNVNFLFLNREKHKAIMENLR